MRKFALLAFFIFLSSPAWAACSGYPYTLTNGTPADANQVMSNFNTVMNCASTAQGVPQGRLTLTSNTPVMTTDATAQSTLYYDCYVGSSVPIYNGTATTSFAIGSCEISLALNSSNQTSGNLYDVFAFTNSGTLSLCAGPAWSSATARSAAITISLGYWTNSSSLTHCYNGATDYGTIAANQATYLGTLYATANGQTGMQFKPAAAAGGSNNVLGLYNAYNRVSTISSSRDSTSSWSYSSGTWRAADNSSSNRIWFVDGLQQSSIRAFYGSIMGYSGGSGGGAMIGIALNGTSTPDSTMGGVDASIVVQAAATATGVYSPHIGLNYVQAVEAANGNTGTALFYTNATQFSGPSGAAQVQQLQINLTM